MKVKIKAVASTAKAISSRANTAGVLSTALIKEISTLLKSSGFVEDRHVDKEGFSFLWTTTNSNCNMSEIELIGSIQSTKSGRKTELLEHIFYRLSRSKKTTKMRELVKNKSFDFSETADLGDSDSLFKYEGFLRKLKSELQANLIIGTPSDKGTDTQAVFTAITKQLKAAGFKQTLNERPKPSGKGFMYSSKAWQHKSGAMVVMQVGCNRDDKNKAETIMSIMRSKAGASRHTSLLPMRKLKFDKADGEWVDKASQKEYIKLLKQMPKAVEKYLTQFK